MAEDKNNHGNQKSSDSQAKNNIGTVGNVDYAKDEGKGSFKKMEKLADKKLHEPNEQGFAENEEDHTTTL